MLYLKVPQIEEGEEARTYIHLNNSRSQRILWLLEELGLDYEVKRYERNPKTMLAPPELLKIHPLGKSPVITDGDLTLAESGAIIEYLVERAPTPFFAKPIAKAISRNVKSAFIQPNIDRHLDYLEAELGKSAWFAGPEFTAADVQMSFPLEAATVRGGEYELLK